MSEIKIMKDYSLRGEGLLGLNSPSESEQDGKIIKPLMKTSLKSFIRAD